MFFWSLFQSSKIRWRRRRRRKKRGSTEGGGRDSWKSKEEGERERRLSKESEWQIRRKKTSLYQRRHSLPCAVDGCDARTSSIERGGGSIRSPLVVRAYERLCAYHRRLLFCVSVQNKKVKLLRCNEMRACLLLLSLELLENLFYCLGFFFLLRFWCLFFSYSTVTHTHSSFFFFLKIFIFILFLSRAPFEMGPDSPLLKDKGLGKDRKRKIEIERKRKKKM